VDGVDLVGRLRGLPAAGRLLPALEGLEGVWFVGGVVRDLLLGRPVGPDVDIAVEGDAVALACALAARLGGSVRAHGRFGTASVLAGVLRVDVAATREERYPRPGALPEVRPAPLDRDLRRRDFTVNAIALRPDGELRTVEHALADLDARRLRVLHDASFLDDPTRLLRLARYAARLGFAPEPRTAALAAAAVAARALRTVSPPRVGTELGLLVREPDVPAALRSADRLGLLPALHPGLALPPDPVLERALALAPPDARRDALGLAACALDVPAPELRSWLGELGWEAGARDAAVAAATGARALAAQLDGVERPSALAALLRGRPPELVALAGALGPEAEARRWLDELRHVRLAIDGHDLRGAGVEPGPGLGRALRAVLDRRLDGDLPDDREAQLAAALEVAHGAGRR
jgi:tRNA nucleotidyltransferase (CCA-adding enzyme)